MGDGPVLPTRLLIVLAMLGGIHSAHAHGIAGNRFFPGTLSFDDPAVADEAIVPNFASFKRSGDAGNIVDNRFDWAFFRLLTPTLGVGVDSAWVHRNWGNALRSGSDVTSLGLKGEVYRNNLHETLVAARLGWGIGHSGAQGVSANAPDSLQPGIFFGKGFGDLPDGLAWLRPFGITGAVTLDHPMTGSSISFGLDPQTGQLSPMLTRNVDTLHWGFALEFSGESAIALIIIPTTSAIPARRVIVIEQLPLLRVVSSPREIVVRLSRLRIECDAAEIGAARLRQFYRFGSAGQARRPSAKSRNDRGYDERNSRREQQDEHHLAKSGFVEMRVEL